MSTLKFDKANNLTKRFEPLKKSFSVHLKSFQVISSTLISKIN